MLQNFKNAREEPAVSVFKGEWPKDAIKSQVNGQDLLESLLEKCSKIPDALPATTSKSRSDSDLHLTKGSNLQRKQALLSSQRSKLGRRMGQARSSNSKEGDFKEIKLQEDDLTNSDQNWVTLCAYDGLLDDICVKLKRAKKVIRNKVSGVETRRTLQDFNPQKELDAIFESVRKFISEFEEYVKVYQDKIMVQFQEKHLFKEREPQELRKLFYKAVATTGSRNFNGIFIKIGEDQGKLDQSQGGAPQLIDRGVGTEITYEYTQDLNNNLPEKVKSQVPGILEQEAPLERASSILAHAFLENIEQIPAKSPPSTTETVVLYSEGQNLEGKSEIDLGGKSSSVTRTCGANFNLPKAKEDVTEVKDEVSIRREMRILDKKLTELKQKRKSSRNMFQPETNSFLNVFGIQPSFQGPLPPPKEIPVPAVKIPQDRIISSFTVPIPSSTPPLQSWRKKSGTSSGQSPKPDSKDKPTTSKIPRLSKLPPTPRSIEKLATVTSAKTRSKIPVSTPRPKTATTPRGSSKPKPIKTQWSARPILQTRPFKLGTFK